ncbi:helix-turn-helix domain-containing protein [Pseudomonas sp. LB3P25]
MSENAYATNQQIPNQPSKVNVQSGTRTALNPRDNRRGYMKEKNYAMKSDIPLKAITYFDAVMRTGSASISAEQLSVTPGADAQQIRSKLEAWLGVPAPNPGSIQLLGTGASGPFTARCLRNRHDQEVRLSLPTSRNPASTAISLERNLDVLHNIVPFLQETV